MTTNPKKEAHRISSPWAGDAAFNPPQNVQQVKLKTGGRAVLRRAVSADAAQLVRMHGRLSPLSRYYRYMRPYVPTSGEMEELGVMAREKGETFVAEVDDPEKRIVGLIYYIREAPPAGHKAEFGVTVEDGFQGDGLGRAMFEYMCEQAKSNDIHLMEAHVLAGNRKMLRLLDTCERPIRKVLSGESFTVTIDISDDFDNAQLCYLADAPAPLSAEYAAPCG